MEYDAIVIGAGVGGVFAAYKLSSKGKRVLLIDKQSLPGGYASIFKRKGFTFEAAVHCVSALGPGGEIRQFLEEEGLDKKVDFIELKDFSRIIYPEHDFVGDFNCDNYINYLKKSFPPEAQNLERFFSELKVFYRQFDSYDKSNLPIWARLLLTPILYPKIIKASILTIGQWMDKYLKDEKLKAILGDIWRFIGTAPSRLCAFYFLMVFRGYYCNPTVYIKGGFIQLFYAIIDSMKKNGSDVMFNTRVTKIITQDGRARGIVTEKGQEIKARIVISNANSIETLTELLDDEDLRKFYSEKLLPMEKSLSAFQIYLGLDVPAKSLGMNHFMYSLNTTYDQDESFNYSVIGGYDLCGLAVVDHQQVDSTLVPQGKGTLLIMALDSHKHWKGLLGEEYLKRKTDQANILIKRVERYLPGLSKHIEVLEVATPKTMQRYSLSPEGAIYGFAQTPLQSSINRLSQETKVKGLFLAGAWTRPGGGIHGAFVSGIEAANLALGLLKKRSS